MSDAEPPWLALRADAVEVRVKVVPRSSRERIAGVIGDRLKIQIHAAPVDGEANRALLMLLARAAGIAPGRLALVAGASGHSKTVVISTADPPATAAKLVAAAADKR